MSGGLGGADRWLHVLVTMELKGVALLSLCALGALVLRRTSAASRHWTWFLGMAGLLALPLVQAVSPHLPAPAPSWTAAFGVPAAGEAPAARPTFPRLVSAAESAPAPAASVSRTEDGVAAPEPSAPTTGPTQARFSVPAALVWIWLLGAGVLLASVVASMLATLRVAAGAHPLPPGPTTDLAERLSERLGIRRSVRLLEGDPRSMPMSWGWLRPVVLLPSGGGAWPRARLEAVLLHELAHVRRMDCPVQIAAEIAVALHWMNPLAWLGARRLRMEREYACDDLVLSAGARPSEYAGELLSLARALRPARGTALAGVAMARPAHLPARLRAVLDATRRRSFGRARAAGAACIAAAFVVALAALTPAQPTPHPSGKPVAEVSTDRDLPNTTIPTVAPQATTCGMESEGWKNVSSQSNNGHRRIEWSKPGCTVEVRIEGDIRFSDEYTEVTGLDRDALLRIDERDGGTERMLEITRGRDGSPSYEYRVDGKDHAFDTTAQAWSRAMLLQLFRRTGFMAHDRVAAILRHGGVPAVLRELDLLNSDFTFATYAEELLKQADLSDAQALDLVKRARTRVDSDYYLASVLQAFAPKHLTSDAMLDEYVASAAGIESDYYRTAVLKTALDRGGLSSEQVAAVLRAASKIQSDYYRTEILSTVAKQYTLAPDMRAAFLKAVSDMQSDYYRAQVLGTLLSHDHLSSDELALVLRAAAGIKSATYATNVLEEVARQGIRSDRLSDAYLGVAADLDSDHYRAQALHTLLEKAGLSEKQVGRVAETAARIDSDHDKAGVLLDILRRYDVTGATRQAVVNAMNTIGSKYYRGQVAERLVNE